MDLEHRPELLVAHLVGHSVPRVAGVVDDDVDLAERIACRLHESFGGAFPGEVTTPYGCLSGDLRGDLFREIGVDVADQDARTVLGQELGGRTADSTRRTGHDRSLAFEHSHTSSFG